ncbi:MAG: Flp pilus assembly protein CpaB [Pseudomonadota bacterium]
MMTTRQEGIFARVGGFGFAAMALGCAALAAYLVGQLLSSRGYTKEPVQPVVVAKIPLPAAQPIERESLQVVNWPVSSVPAGAVGQIEDLFREGKRPIPTSGILQGEPVVVARLARQDQGTGLAVLVRTGYRAVAVEASGAIGRSRLVYPGARVDVISTIKDPKGSGASTRIAVENALVLAVEAETDVVTRKAAVEGEAKTENPDTIVTIEVTPADAEIVSLAQREGKIDLALRNASDETMTPTPGATPQLLFADPPLPPEQAEAIDPRTGRPTGMAVAGPGSPASANSPPATESSSSKSRRTRNSQAGKETSSDDSSSIEMYNAHAR